jgi:hypothetical protein
MIVLQLAVFAAGLLCFWLATDLEADETPQQQPHLRMWGRFYPS